MIHLTYIYIIVSPEYPASSASNISGNRSTYGGCVEWRTAVVANRSTIRWCPAHDAPTTISIRVKAAPAPIREGGRSAAGVPCSSDNTNHLRLIGHVLPLVHDVRPEAVPAILPPDPLKDHREIHF